MRTDNRNEHNNRQVEYYAPIDRHRKRMQVSDSLYIQNHINRFEKAAGKLDGKIIDVGCGMGKFTIPLFRRGCKIDGLDLSADLLRELNLVEAGIKARQADIHQPPADLAGQYDLLSGFFMLHHLEDLSAAFSGMASLLKPGGRAVFVDVNPWCGLYYLQIFLSPSMRWAAERGLLKLTRSNLMTKLSAAGFSSIEIKRYGILPPFLRNHKAGTAFENAFDTIRVFRPVSAFQVISAVKA